MDFNNNNSNNNYGVYQTSFAGIMNKVYGLMFIGLMITAGVAYWLASSMIVNISVAKVFLNPFTIIALSIAEIALVWKLSANVLEMSHDKAMIMFGIYAILNGLTLSSIFLIYNIADISTAFFTTAVTFGVMSAYGYFTKADLTGIGKILFFGLIGIIIASLVNMFIHSGPMNLFISYAGVVIFLGLTAYDTQKIKEFHEASGNENVAVAGALRLYLDFINLFLFLLRIFASNRD